MKNLIVMISLLLVGCEGCSHMSADIAAGSTSHDFIVIQYGCDKPVKCWKLNQTTIQTNNNGAQWLGENGNMVYISGNWSIIETNDINKTYSQYCKE